ncbi:hypothetical protein HDU67_003162, partial [Dinochytrium kinnereticum]
MPIIDDYSRFFTPVSSRRKPSAIRALQKVRASDMIGVYEGEGRSSREDAYMGEDRMQGWLMKEERGDAGGMISLGGGNPHPSTFPITGLSFKMRDGDVVDIPETEVAKALQYSATNGLPDLVSWLKNLQSREHQPLYSNFEICVGNGSQDLLTKAFDMFLTEQDTLLCEAPAYVGSLAYLRPLGCKFAEVEVDQDGLVPESVDRILSGWENPRTKPRVLYSVPTGGNPTGASTTLE